MTGLIVCTLVFLILLVATLTAALSTTRKAWLTSNSTVVVMSFVLSSALGFVLTNDLLELPNPIVLTVTAVLAGAVLLELAQSLLVRQKAALRDIALVLLGSCLFVLARYVMHETGMNIVDRFEVFLD